MAKHEFTSENQPDPEKKKRGKAKKTLMLDAIRAQVEGGEEEFLKRVVEYSIGHNGHPAIEATEEADAVDEILPSPPHPKLLALVLNRIEPPLKATMPLIDFEFDISAEPHQQAAQVIDAVSKGDISPDIGHMFVSSIKSMIEIHEFTELKSRIEKIEEILSANQ